jgi:hypothetical protein
MIQVRQTESIAAITFGNTYKVTTPEVFLVEASILEA